MSTYWVRRLLVNFRLVLDVLLKRTSPILRRPESVLCIYISVLWISVSRFSISRVSVVTQSISFDGNVLKVDF